MLTEEVLIEDQIAIDFGGGGAQDAQDGIGEDGGLAEVLFFVGVFLGELLGGGRFNGLKTSWC